MTIAAHISGCGNNHTFFRMLRPVRSVAGFTSDPSQHKLAGIGIVTRGMAGKTLAGLFHLLQINLKDGVKRGLSVGGVRPGLKFGLVTLAAALWALVVPPNRKSLALFSVQGHTLGW